MALSTTSGAVLLLASAGATPFSWPFDWARLPTAMFGCNTSGPENAAQMAFNARFGITIYEARTMMALHNYTDTEHWLQVQAAAMKSAHPNEPVFVPDPQGQNEDDGVILTDVIYTDDNSTYLVVLNASTMEEIGRAGPTPHIVPHGFHGRYLVW